MDMSRLKTTRTIANLKAGRNDWYRIVRNQTDTSRTSVMLYDEIGWFGITAQDFINDLKQVAGPIDLHLSSPGGEVFDGLAIYQYLSGRGDVTTHIDSLAASIASVIAMAGTEIVIGKNASVMIHDGFGLCVGNAADMREQADLLDRVSDNIADVYATRTGKPADEWRKLMLAETWFFGQEAVDAGLADRLAQKPAQAAQPDGDDEGENSLRKSPAAHFDLSVFRNVPERLKAVHAGGGEPFKVELDWTPGPAAAEELLASLRQNVRIRNHAAEEADLDARQALMQARGDAESQLKKLADSAADSPPTTTQPPDEAPADTDRGFSVPAEGPMDSIPAKPFREWLNQGLKLVGEAGPEPTALPPGVPVQAAATHEPYDGTHTHAHPAFGAQGDDGTHEHEHTHNNDADHHHDHGDDGEGSNGDGGMTNARRGDRILGIESMPLLNRALPVHHTAVVDEPWDGPAAVAAMPNDASVLEYCHAWEDSAADDGTADDPDGDADDKKSSWKFPHHLKKGGPANLAACRNGLARLPGSKIPDSDKSGVEKHLQAHLDDAESGDDSPENHTHDDLEFTWDPSMTAALKEALQ